MADSADPSCLLSDISKCKLIMNGQNKNTARGYTPGGE